MSRFPNNAKDSANKSNPVTPVAIIGFYDPATPAEAGPTPLPVTVVSGGGGGDTKITWGGSGQTNYVTKATPLPTALVDALGTTVDFSTPAQIATLYRDFKLAAGQKPPVIAIGEQQVLQGDKYGVMRVSLATDGKETTSTGINTATGQQTFSNDTAPVIVTLAGMVDNRNSRIMFQRAVTNVKAENTLTAANNATLLSSSACRAIRARGRNTSTNVLYLKLYDKATLATEADVPYVVYAIEPSAPFDIDLSNYFTLNGLSMRVTRGVTNGDTAMSDGDITAFSLFYAR